MSTKPQPPQPPPFANVTVDLPSEELEKLLRSGLVIPGGATLILQPPAPNKADKP